MSVKNTVKVYIDGILQTSKTVIPLKWGDFLDERLDESHLSLRAIKKEFFQPLTPVEIQIDNEKYYGIENKKNQWLHTQTRYYIVANDGAEEAQIGSGLYNHDLTLIEVTKVAECCVVDTTTITNSLGRSYTSNAAYAVPIFN